LECRVSGADANPYLAAAAIIGAALLGVVERLEPGEPVVGNAYDVADRLVGAERFPVTLREAAGRFAASAAARTLFGDAFVDHYVASRLWESREYERSLNDWQLDRYFEII
jgi:glutamine synthetase